MNKHYKTAEVLANLMDNKFSLFGIKFGIDPILGLIPGFGDFLSLLLSTYIVWVGIQLKLPFLKVIKMLWNVLIDFLAGLIPVVGDLSDIAIKANLRNVAILKKHIDDTLEGHVI